jgi:hypothetical protein
MIASLFYKTNIFISRKMIRLSHALLRGQASLNHRANACSCLNIALGRLIKQEWHLLATFMLICNTGREKQ